MDSKRASANNAAKKSGLDTGEEINLHISAYEDGYLVQGDLTGKYAELKEFATWMDEKKGWYISRRRAHEYDHHYGLSLFSKTKPGR